MARELDVAILGAGTVAPAIVRDLAESDEVARLRVLDLDGDRARRLADEHGGGRADAAAADALAGLEAALDGFDVVVNAASYRMNEHVMDAALAAGCHYVDLGGLYWVTDRQLRRHLEFAAAGLLALLGMGSSPGKTNVLAVRAVRELGGADELHVAAAGRDPAPVPEGRVRFPYALRTLLDELQMSPVVVHEGRPVEVEPLSDGGVVDFPAPVGAATTIHTLHSELRTFPMALGCREASFRLSLAPELLHRLRRLAAAPGSEVEAAAAAAVAPSAEAVAVHLVDARANGRAVRVSAVTRPHERWRIGGGVVSTGTPASAAVRLLARGRITGRGVLPPESCVDPDDLFPELEERGCTFELTG